MRMPKLNEDLVGKVCVCGLGRPFIVTHKTSVMRPGHAEYMNVWAGLGLDGKGIARSGDPAIIAESAKEHYDKLDLIKTNKQHQCKCSYNKKETEDNTPCNRILNVPISYSTYESSSLVEAVRAFMALPSHKRCVTLPPKCDISIRASGGVQLSDIIGTVTNMTLNRSASVIECEIELNVRPVAIFEMADRLQSGELRLGMALLLVKQKGMNDIVKKIISVHPYPAQTE